MEEFALLPTRVSKRIQPIIFIHVWKHIFFDKDGKEVYRHMEFMKEKDIVEQLKKMGVPFG